MAWDRQFREGYLAWLGETRKAWRNGLWTLFAVSMVGVVIAAFCPPVRYAVWFFFALAGGFLAAAGVSRARRRGAQGDCEPHQDPEHVLAIAGSNSPNEQAIAARLSVC